MQAPIPANPHQLTFWRFHCLHSKLGVNTTSYWSGWKGQMTECGELLWPGTTGVGTMLVFTHHATLSFLLPDPITYLPHLDYIKALLIVSRSGSFPTAIPTLISSSQSFLFGCQFIGNKRVTCSHSVKILNSLWFPTLS